MTEAFVLSQLSLRTRHHLLKLVGGYAKQLVSVSYPLHIPIVCTHQFTGRLSASYTVQP